VVYPKPPVMPTRRSISTETRGAGSMSQWETENSTKETSGKAPCSPARSLGNVVGIVDRNRIQIDGDTEDVMPLSRRWGEVSSVWLECHRRRWTQHLGHSQRLHRRDLLRSLGCRKFPMSRARGVAYPFWDPLSAKPLVETDAETQPRVTVIVLIRDQHRGDRAANSLRSPC
jgi:hypothetical protein